ncbi:MAG: carbohydrate porin [Tsuneonella sp.]
MAWRVALAALLAAANAPLAAADEPPAPPPEPPIVFDAVYTADIWRNEGGTRDGWRYLDNLDLTVSADLDRAAGVPNTRAFVYVLYNNGASLSELTGDAQTVSNIETGVRAVRLYEAWLEHDLTPAASVRVGLYDLNSEFDALDASALFIGSAHGIGTDISHSGRNGPSIFPVTSLAARFALQASRKLTVRAAVLDAVPGDPDHPARTAILLRDGALGIAEADWRSGKLRVLAGAWGYSRPQDRLGAPGTTASRGAYLRGEMCLLAGEPCRLAAFARTGIAAGKTNPFDRFVSGGVTGRIGERWQLGAALAHARTSASARRSGYAWADETAVELTAAWRVSRWLTLQPDAQFVLNSGERGASPNAAAFGLRFVFAPFE